MAKTISINTKRMQKKAPKTKVPSASGGSKRKSPDSFVILLDENDQRPSISTGNAKGLPGFGRMSSPPLINR